MNRRYPPREHVLRPKGNHGALGPFPQQLSNTKGNSEHRPHQIVVDVVLEIFQEIRDVGMSYPTEKPDLGRQSTHSRVLNPSVGRYFLPDDELDGDIASTVSSRCHHDK